MKKKIISMIIILIILMTGTCQAASYTLPEKMYNQLSIGSGLKGSFSIYAEGDYFSTPFINVIKDAEWSVRGIRSGNDLHYYLFQSNALEEQAALSELYRKDGIYYFRSDMVQGTILAFPVLSQYISTLFPESGENGSSSSFIAKILELPESIRKEKWEPVLQKYQNELEMWLADFTVTADTVKMENGLSALDFTYEIPMENVNEQIIKLYGEITADPEASGLLDSVMTEEEKSVYMNGNLLYYYLEALRSLGIDKPVRMTKRVSAIGDMLRFRLELPLDERTTGYSSVVIENISQLTVITLRKTGQITVFAFPEKEKMKQSEFEQSLWFARIDTDPEKIKENVSVRIDIRKTNEVYEQDEKTHETNRYDVLIQQDTTYLPADIDFSVLPEFEQIHIAAEFHYSSKYAQNSATTLEITADVNRGNAGLTVQGKMKTAAPWLFMPFEIIDPVQVGTEKADVLEPYFTDWISNASSMIHYTVSESDTDQPDTTSQSQKTESEEPASEQENQEAEAETSPLDVEEQE